MCLAVYRFTTPTTVMIQDGGGQRFAEIPVGSRFLTENSKPDRNGMFEGTCEGSQVFIFARDLIQGAEAMADDPRVHSLSSQIDAALALVCLAGHDVRTGQVTPRAVQLLEGAILAHKAVIHELDALAAESEQDKPGLQERAETLLNAIRSAESEFQILLERDQISRRA